MQFQTPDFNFYKRYRWRADDFQDFRDTLSSYGTDVAQAFLGPCILSGFGVAPSGSGMVVTVAGGVAFNSAGESHYQPTDTNLTLTAPLVNPKLALIVIRPTYTPGEYINRPTSPGDLVPLKSFRSQDILLIDGVEAAAPVYPDPNGGDIVVAGVNLTVGQTTISTDDCDFQVRDIIRNRQEDFFEALSDPRMRPTRTSGAVTTITASVLNTLKYPRFQSYLGGLNASTFPRDVSGNFAGGDTTINWTTGTVGGADAWSGNFTPTLPAAGSSIWALVCLDVNDKLKVLYGTAGTRRQCVAAMAAQTSSGAGSIPLSSMYRICYVLLKSSGAAIVDNQVYDVRHAQVSAKLGQGTFTLANNQVAAASVTGLVFDPTYYRSVVLWYDIYRKTNTATTECREVGRLILTYSQETGTWLIDRDGVQQRNDSGIVFSMSANQLQYTSTNIAGTGYAGKLNYRISEAFNA